MARTLISFPAELVPQGSGVWLSSVYMWKKLEGIQDHLDCDFLCLFPEELVETNCILNFPSEHVSGIIVSSTRMPYFLKNATKLRNTLNHMLERGAYQNLILFEPHLLNLYLAQVGRRRNMKIISWLCGDYLRSGLMTFKAPLDLFQRFKVVVEHASAWLIMRYMTQFSRMVVTDSPHLYRNRQRVFFAPSQSFSRSEMATLPCARVGEKETLSLLFVGRVVPLKGIHNLIQALAALKDLFAFHLTIVGSLRGASFGGYEFTLRRLIEEKGLGRRVTFTDNISDRGELEQYYLQSDLFVLPSLTEGVSKAMLEAMAYGLPVVASRVGGIPLVVRDGRDGILFDPRNLIDLQTVLRRMLGDRPRLRLMGQSARGHSLQCSKDYFFRRLAQEITRLS